MFEIALFIATINPNRIEAIKNLFSVSVGLLEILLFAWFLLTFPYAYVFQASSWDKAASYAGLVAFPLSVPSVVLGRIIKYVYAVYTVCYGWVTE